MPISLHSHSGQFCKHAKGTLEEVVVEAIRKKFKVYGLSEHVPRYRAKDLYPEEDSMSTEDLFSQYEDFLNEAHRLKEKYASQISLLVGAETEYISARDMDGLEHLLRHFEDKIEYLVGSVHHANEIPIDFDRETFMKAVASFTSDSSADTHLTGLLVEHYLDVQYDLLLRFRPEVVGHFDLFRLFDPKLRLHDLPNATMKAERNIAFACEYGALFELNAAAFRKGWTTAYPAADIMEIIVKHNGRFTLSDDSHGPHAVGLNFDKLREYAQATGIKELWYLRKADSKSTGRKLSAAKVEGNWWEHDFWGQARK